MKKQKTVCALLAMLWVVALFVMMPSKSSGQGQLPWGRDLKIGGIWPMTGAGAVWGLGMARGSELGCEDINKSGGIVFGGQRHKVKAFNEDDQYKGALTVVKAKKLIEEVKIDSFIGIISSAGVLATQPLTEQANIIQFCCSQGSIVGIDHPLTFRAVSSVFMNADAFYNWCKENHPNLKRVADIAVNDASGWGPTHGNTFNALKYGYEIVFQENYERGLTDFNPLVGKALRSNPDIIVLSGVPPGDSGLVVKAAREAGFDKVIYGPTRQNLGVIVNVAGPQFSHNVYSTEYIPWDPKAFPGAKKFYEAYIGKGYEWEGLATTGYWFTQCFKAAVESANSTDGKKMAAALKRIKIDTIEGPIHFGSPFGVTAYYPIPISTVKDGKAIMVGYKEPKVVTEGDYKFEFKRSLITP